MSFINLTKVAQPSTPVVNTNEIYVDTLDRRLKQLDDNGLVSVLNNIGAMDGNLLDNGGFAIQQRMAAGATTPTGLSTTTRAGQIADRWALTASVATNLTWSQIDSSGSAEAGLLARYYGSLIASSAGKKVMISQFIINTRMAHVRGQKVRVSVKLNQKVGAGQTYHLGLLQLNLSGTVDTCPAFLTGAWSTTTGVDPVWGTNLVPIAPDASPTGENGTISGSWLNITSQAAAWQRSSAVFSIPSTAKNLCVVLFSDATGGATDNLSIAEFQITQGADICDFVPTPFSAELANCQAYFCKSFPQGVAPAGNLSVATAGFGAAGILGKSGSATALGSQIPISFPVTMFKAPSVTYFTPVTITSGVIYRHNGTTPAAQGATATIASSITDHGCIVAATNEATTNGAVGDLVSVHYTADSEFVT